MVNHIKPLRSAEQIAVEGRSPNRKPRYRGMQRKQVKENKQEASIALAATGKGEDDILALLHLAPSAIEYWKRNDSEFKRRYGEAIEAAIAVTRGELAGSLRAAAKRIHETITGKSESELAYRASEGLVKGMGAYNQNPTQIINVNSKTQINIITRDENAKKLVEQIMVGERLANGNQEEALNA